MPVFLRKFDWVLAALALAILLLGLATFYAMGPAAHGVMIRHGIFIAIGLLVMVLAAVFDYRVFKNYSAPSLILYTIAVVLLGFALASQAIRGSSAWLTFGGFQFEPSEFAKLAMLVLLAKYFSQKHIEIYRMHHLLVASAYVGLPLILTLLQPDLGSVIVYAALWIAMLLFAGIKRKHLLALLMLGVVGISLGWFLVLKPYQRSRIISFVNPYLDAKGTGYNTIQSKITFGSGKLTGTYFSGRQDTTPVLVPEPFTDFTFATYAQKFGFIGVMVLMLLIAALVWRISTIALKSDNNFARLFCLGYMTIFCMHVLVNGGMNLGILPITGIPFPLLSHGGSHLVTMMAGLGIIQSIRMRSRII